jgi:hypothetical protein
VASDLPGVLSNIARFGEEVEKSRALQKRLAYARFSHAAYAFCVFNRVLSRTWLEFGVTRSPVT